MGSKLFDKAVDVMARRVDRRSVLTRSAMVGSAMVAAPLDFALRPNTAYAAICSCNGTRCACGSRCCGGWTEFCCTLNGQNRCPDGTVTGGWWKVDGSQFCGGGPRYYLDCNAQCGGCGCGRPGGICSGACSGTGCGCGKGDCNNWKSGCVQFRYGQCHQEIPCIGPIVCRVVTCVAPWAFDPACSTASRTSEATRSHHRSCVNEPFGVLDAARDVGGALLISGWAIDQAPGATPTHVQLMVDAKIVATVLADRPRADIAAAYPAYPGGHGFEGYVLAAPGTHLVCAYGVDADTGASKFLGIAVAVVAPPLGALDGVDVLGGGVVRIVSWMADRANPNEPIIARVIVDGNVIGQAFADAPRPDVAASVPEIGPNHGFVTDMAIGPGRHTVCVDAVFRSGAAVSLGCRVVDVT